MSAPRVPAPRLSSFDRAVAEMHDVRLRAEISVSEVPAPARIAPRAAALAGDVVVHDEEVATGRFILLHDPAAPAEWGGTFRVVTYVRADLEPEFGEDPLLGQVGWAWLEEGLSQAGARAVGTGGTVTRVLSEGYGELAERPASVDVEVRASWTPVLADDGDVAVGAHLQAWAALLCAVAGLPPLPEGVSALAQRMR
ncbi:DUF3000 domain-containing protein [Kineococcus xinjiangensis]|uniref:DUF3000 domain-containing protein n=1 Tax=Kineococcus xinjiangensis TaxID=512762 RepID=UPI001FEAC557|nr:DUF3000 domain-containing protein [Kineococcus xinjiangensis]